MENQDVEYHIKNQKLVKATNQLLLSTKDQLQQLQVLPFNDQMIHQHLDGIVDSTVVHRIMKFERPDHSHTESLKRKCVEDWLVNEDRLREVPKNYFQKPAKLRANIGKARRLILEWTRGYESILKTVDLRFPNGETFISMQGRVSFHQKLLNKEIFGLNDSRFVGADAVIESI